MDNRTDAHLDLYIRICYDCRYRWGRSAEEEREKRAAEPRLEKVSSLNKLPVNSISNLAENVSVAYQPDVWTNDMIFKVDIHFNQSSFKYVYRIKTTAPRDCCVS